MEDAAPGNEPVPVVLFKIGLKCYQQQLIPEAITAISAAMKYAYPQLKSVELSGDANINRNVVVYIPDNGRCPTMTAQNAAEKTEKEKDVIDGA